MVLHNFILVFEPKYKNFQYFYNFVQDLWLEAKCWYLINLGNKILGFEYEKVKLKHIKGLEGKVYLSHPMIINIELDLNF